MELKELQEQIQKTLHDFREYVDKEIKEVKASGVPSPETTDTIKRLNARIDELQAKIQRPAGGSEGKAEPTEYEKAFDGYIRRGREADVLKANLSGDDGSGGFNVSPAMNGRIVQKIYETSPMRQAGAAVVSITTDALEGPIDNDQVTQGWVGETTSRTETTAPTVGKWRIPVFEQYAEPRQTQNFLDDAGVDVGAWLERKIADKFIRTQNVAFCTGTGTVQPKGITSYTTAATSDATRAWGIIEHVASGVAGDFTNPDKLYDIEAALKSGYRSGAVWFGLSAILLKIRKFKGGDGQYLWQPGLQAGAPSRLISYPFYMADDMPAIASNALSLAFANFGEAYQIVDRQGFRVLRDPFTSKPYVKFYATNRVGGGVINFEAIKLLKLAAA